MNLQDEENVIKVFHHHPTTFFIKAINYLFVSLPFYFVGYFISTALNGWQALMVYGSITIVFCWPDFL